jgi:DNA-binding NarL/FixJ family response regulator
MADPRDPTVVLADDHIATRTGVRRALESDGIRVVAEVSTAAEAVEAAMTHRPDVCLLALHIPGGGITVAERISDTLPETKTVILGDSELCDDVLSAVRAGAVGYLLTSASAKRLPHTIRGVARGEAALSRMMAASVLRELRIGVHRSQALRSASGAGPVLTPRELDVAQLLRHRMGTTEIALRLQINEVTVRRHVSAIMRKLGVPDRQSAVELLDRVGSGRE